jgi:hypothetical protein
VACMAEKGKVYKVLVRKPERKRPLGRPRRRQETGWEGVDWIHLAKNGDPRQALVNTVMNLRVLAPRS